MQNKAQDAIWPTHRGNRRIVFMADAPLHDNRAGPNWVNLWLPCPVQSAQSLREFVNFVSDCAHALIIKESSPPEPPTRR